MHLPPQLAKHIREVYFGGNWTSVSLKESLSGISWEQATTKVYSLNTIVTLVYDINYYIRKVTKALEGEAPDANDKCSFDDAPIQSQEDWESLLATTWTDAEYFASLVEQLPNSKLEEIFVEEKHGNYYRNIQGIIEHSHYHLGQIVLIKKIWQQVNITSIVDAS